MGLFKKKPKEEPKKPPPTKKYNRDREGRGKCKECGAVNGHRAGCYRGGT